MWISLHCIAPIWEYHFPIHILAFFRGIPDWCIDAYLTHQSHFSLKELINNNLQAFHNSSRCVVAHSADPWVCAVAYDCVTCMELLLRTRLVLSAYVYPAHLLSDLGVLASPYLCCLVPLMIAAVQTFKCLAPFSITFGWWSLVS